MGNPWRVKYDGTCARCGTALLEGMPAVWDRATRTIHCIECPTTKPRPPEQPPTPPSPPEPVILDKGVAGHSARVEHERRTVKREAAITERWGTGLVSKVIRAVSVEPQSTRAWAIGAAGEEKLAAELDKVAGLRMLHDRRVPGTRGNIDHIVIAPAGVFVVDAKNNEERAAVADLDPPLERAGLNLGSDVWSVRRYAAYLDHMHRWAEALECEPRRRRTQHLPIEPAPN